MPDSVLRTQRAICLEGVVKLNCIDFSRNRGMAGTILQLQPFFLDRIGVGSSSAGKAGNGGLVKCGALNLRTTPLCMPSNVNV